MTVMMLLSLISPYLSGILIAWSLALASMFGFAITHNVGRNKKNRITDYFFLILLMSGAGFITHAIYLVPETTVRYLDVFVGAEIWYGVFLTYINCEKINLIEDVINRITSSIKI